MRFLPNNECKEKFVLSYNMYPKQQKYHNSSRSSSILSFFVFCLSAHLFGTKQGTREMVILIPLPLFIACCVAQAAPSMIFLPPHTVKEKVAALRSCLPGVNLYNFLKGMPTALGRSKETVPRGMSQLKEVRRRNPRAFVVAFKVAQLPLFG